MSRLMEVRRNIDHLLLVSSVCLVNDLFFTCFKYLSHPWGEGVEL